MLLKTSIVFAVLFIVFGLIYLKVSKNKKRKKAGRVLGILSLLSLISALVMISLFIKIEDIKIFNKVKTYDVLTSYNDALSKKGADKAYEFLPVRVCADNDGIYFINSKNDLFKIEKNDDGYAAKTKSNSIANVKSSKTINATLSDGGALTLDGYFLYSKFEQEYVSFKNKKIASDVASFSLTSNSLMYVTNDGKLYSMGFNEYGQLGDQSTKNRSEPEFIKDGIKKAEISDTHSMIVDKYGTLYAVGDNSHSQLGNKTAVSSTDYTKIIQGVKDIQIGSYLSLVLSVNGELYTAGKNDLGQLGNGGESFKAELILALSGVERISAKDNTCAALTHSGELYVWGDNKNGKAGAKDAEFVNVPTKIADNVYDFALSENGIVIINYDRDILVHSAGETITALEFNATVPDALKTRPDTPFTATDKRV